NELGYSLAVEKLAGVEVPERGQWIRVIMCELNRITSHLVWLATSGLELGALSMATYAFREREMILDLYQSITGLRMNHAYIRPGGVALDFRPEHEASIKQYIPILRDRFHEYENFLSKNPIWIRRNKGLGVLDSP